MCSLTASSTVLDVQFCIQTSLVCGGKIYALDKLSNFMALTGVTQLLELDQENLIHSIFFYIIVLILYRYENMCI